MKNYHIIPNNDLIDHVESNDCPCNPDVEINDNGTLVVHHALDQREIFEQRDMFNNRGCVPCVDTKCNCCDRPINKCECTDHTGQSVWNWKRK